MSKNTSNNNITSINNPDNRSKIININTVNKITKITNIILIPDINSITNMTDIYCIEVVVGSHILRHKCHKCHIYIYRQGRRCYLVFNS